MTEAELKSYLERRVGNINKWWTSEKETPAKRMFYKGMVSAFEEIIDILKEDE